MKSVRTTRRSRAVQFVLIKALFASALTFAASCFASSEISLILNAFSAGEGGALVGGVVNKGVEDPDEDPPLIVVYNN